MKKNKKEYQKEYQKEYRKTITDEQKQFYYLIKHVRSSTLITS